MRKIYLFLLMLPVSAAILNAQIVPDLGEYKTLKCDLHMHTVFSDGLVWPTIRVDEAVNEGIDVIAITDHLEYLPHKKYLKEDHNFSFEIAAKRAKRKDIICIAGVEFTRWMPPGHFNAIFIQDANKLIIKEFLPAIEEAVRQGAFIFWNHPGWIVHQPDRVVRWYDIHTTLIERGWMHGIEFANWHDYYPAVLKYTNEHDLAVLGNSDIHGISSEAFSESAHRPLTLVFAEKRNEESVKEALFAGRSIAVTEKNILAGPEKLVEDFVRACLKIDVQGNDALLENTSEIPFIFSARDGNKFILSPLGRVLLPDYSENIWDVVNVYVDKNVYLQLAFEK